MSPLRTTAAPDAAAVFEIAAVTLVDRAVDAVRGRGCTTRDEATLLLDEIRANVGDPALRAAVTAVVDAALSAYRGDQLVDKWRVINPLLDIRLVLAPPMSG